MTIWWKLIGTSLFAGLLWGGCAVEIRTKSHKDGDEPQSPAAGGTSSRNTGGTTAKPSPSGTAGKDEAPASGGEAGRAQGTDVEGGSSSGQAGGSSGEVEGGSSGEVEGGSPSAGAGGAVEMPPVSQTACVDEFVQVQRCLKQKSDANPEDYDSSAALERCLDAEPVGDEAAELIGCVAGEDEGMEGDCTADCFEFGEGADCRACVEEICGKGDDSPWTACQRD